MPAVKPTWHIREGFTKKVAVLLDFVQITPLHPFWTSCTTFLAEKIR